MTTRTQATCKTRLLSRAVFCPPDAYGARVDGLGTFKPVNRGLKEVLMQVLRVPQSGIDIKDPVAVYQRQALSCRRQQGLPSGLEISL